MKYIRLTNVDSVRQITVVEVKSIVGKGTPEDPIHQIIEYFLPDGTRLARVQASDKPYELHEWVLEDKYTDEENTKENTET